ncbi:hypothetical protein [Leucobacter sp. NPDC077196]|uniref:hypothetical protein n=1 Tax=Leucobacter sp. NPDC077196 TaxID=3154959 RepID=UPI003427AD3B
MDRLLLVDGRVHEITCAVLADGITSPVVDLLEQLDAKSWPAPGITVFPDEYQVKMKSRFLAQAEHLAEFGDLETPYNRLEEGIWEFKIETLRVSFFDTPGDGTFEPKFGTDHTQWDGKTKAILPEDFDEFIRVGHYFPKTGEWATQEDIDRSIEVRAEDLSHDTN